jgi:hypothetical protein
MRGRGGGGRMRRYAGEVKRVLREKTTVILLMMKASSIRNLNVKTALVIPNHGTVAHSRIHYTVQVVVGRGGGGKRGKGV